MIYKISLDDVDAMMEAGAMFIVQNETHVLYQHNDGLDVPESVTILDSYDESELSNLYAADEWLQPQPESADSA